MKTSNLLKPILAMRLEDRGGGMRRPMLSSIVASDKLAFTAPLAFNLLRQTSVTLVKSAVKLSAEMHAAFKNIYIHGMAKIKSIAISRSLNIKDKLISVGHHTWI